MKYSETYPTGKIVNFYYTDPKKRFVEVVWYNEEKDRSWISTFAKDGEMYNSFLEEFSEEELEKNSREEFKQRQQRLDARILEYIENNPEHTKSLISDKFFETFVKYCINEITPEELFKLKLTAFENESIKESSEREKKTNLRKAKTFEEIISALTQFKTE
jgi:hypothetical protein